MPARVNRARRVRRARAHVLAIARALPPVGIA
jgi:hypothetical protein